MATPTTPIRLPGDPLPPPPEPRYPWRVGVTMLGLVVLVLVVVWLAFQALKGPPTADQFPSPATATAIERNFEATVSAADTAQPRPTPRPTPQPATQAPVVPTSAPAAVAAPAVVPAATSQVSTTAPGSATGSSATTAATPAPPVAANAAAQAPPPAAPARTTTAVPAGADESTSTTPEPTVTAALAQEVSEAYNEYWQVKADAFYTVDPSRLSDVAIGAELARLQQQIADDQANGRATRVRVQHNFVVLSADNDQAQIADDYRDLSVWIDPTSDNPLPGQIEPTSADTAPEHKVVVYLQLSDHTWKVADGVELVGQEPPQ